MKKGNSVDDFVVKIDAKLDDFVVKISDMLCGNSILLKYFEYQLSPKLKTVSVNISHTQKMIQN